MVTAEKLEAGKLYQVKHWEKGWIIAEYMKEIAAHSYKYNNIYFEPKMEIGPERTREVPLSHQWKFVRAMDATYPATFTITDAKMEIRPCTDDAVATIATMKAEVVRLDAETKAARKRLREFCE